MEIATTELTSAPSGLLSTSQLPTHRYRVANMARGGLRTNTKAQHPNASATGEVAETWQQIACATQSFKMAIAQADRQALRNQGEIPAALVDEVRAGFQALCELLNEELGDASRLSAESKEQLGAQLQSELLPYLLLTGSAEKWYSKPRGYAGDFMTIAEIYRNEPIGAGRIGALLDRCLLDVPAAIAVQNRRRLLMEEIMQTLARKPSDEPVYVTSLACGPAAEIFDVFERLDNPTRLHVTLIDIDYQALAYVADKVASRKLQRQIHLHQGNLIYLATGRQRLELPPQDLVYSIGLIDYLSDKLVLALVNWIYQLLGPGGRVLLGNFHPRNSTKALMDYVLDWKLIHRCEAEMDALYAQSAFQQACSKIRFEAQEINLFAECIKCAANVV